MRKITIMEHISLDGVVQSPGGRYEDGDYEHGGWSMRFSDEIILIVYPVLLGKGKRFFSDNAYPQELQLVDSKAGESGVFYNTYRYVGALATESSDGN